MEGELVKASEIKIGDVVPGPVQGLKRTVVAASLQLKLSDGASTTLPLDSPILRFESNDC